MATPRPIAAHHAANPRGKHGAYSYALAAFLPEDFDPEVFKGATPPLISEAHYARVTDYIKIGLNEARLVVGGLAAHITRSDKAQISAVARKLRAGSIYVNGATMSFDAPFGGCKMLGQGREHGAMGLM